MRNLAEKNILMIALKAGEIMLISGSEIYRVEDTVTRICKAYGIPYAEVFVTTTGIFISLDSGGEKKPYTIIKRIRGVSVDLEKISLVNNFSRKLNMAPIPFDEANIILDDILKREKFTFPLQILGGALIASFFTLMLGAGYKEFLSSFFIGMSAYTFAHFLDKFQFNLFLRNFTVCVLIALSALVFTSTGLAHEIDSIIVGSLMIFLPGLAFTNAMRDSLSGDLLSGGARALEAVLVAISIAFGVGVTLFAWKYFGGSI
jgi:uncharacterized membrane protein YjjP (DUF1212 family)